MQLKKLILTDFKGVRSAEYDFSEITKIMGQNGSGKSSIATAWFWLWVDRDYELKSNPNIRPNGVEECLPRVEAVLDINGAEVTIAKQQKRSVSKPNDKEFPRLLFLIHTRLIRCQRRRETSALIWKRRGLCSISFLH